MGKALLTVDSVVAVSVFWVFGIQAGLYSVLGLFAKAFVIITTSSEIVGRGFRSV